MAHFIVVEINDGQLKEKKSINSGLAAAGQSATIIQFWQRLKGRHRNGKTLYWKKRKASGMS